MQAAVLIARATGDDTAVEMMHKRGFIPSYIKPDAWRKNFHCWTPFEPEGLKLVLDELTREGGVEVRFFTKVIDADADERQFLKKLAE